jgi:tartrate-resistant acid phosphatase type 5
MKKSRPILIGLLISAVAVVSGISFWQSRDPRPREGEPARLYGAPSTPPVWAAKEIPSDENAVSFFVIGDQGFQNEAKRAVAKAMCDLVARARPDFALTVGDNFYLNGVKSVEDDLWRTHFEQAFREDCLNIPFYAALGNHDYNGNIQAQIEYTALSSRWRMPSCYYALSSVIEKGISLEIFVLDTQPIRNEDRTSDSQLRWLEDKLERSTAHWKIVVGHHPIVSNGVHQGSSTVARRVTPLLERYDVDLYLAGHDHDLQLLRTGSKWLQVVSGAGSAPRSTSWEDDTIYAAAEPGFAWISAGRDDLWIQFVTAKDGATYIHRIEKRVQQ